MFTFLVCVLRNTLFPIGSTWEIPSYLWTKLWWDLIVASERTRLPSLQPFFQHPINFEKGNIWDFLSNPQSHRLLFTLEPLSSSIAVHPITVNFTSQISGGSLFDSDIFRFQLFYHLNYTTIKLYTPFYFCFDTIFPYIKSDSKLM